MEDRDIPTVARLHKEYQAQFKLTPVFSEEDCRHWLMPRDGVVMAYVVEVCGVDFALSKAVVPGFVRTFKFKASMAGCSAHSI